MLEDFPLATLREFIDWSPFFHTWELRGVYPSILEHEKYGEQARKLFADAQELLDEIIAKKLLTARAVYGFFPANAVGDDVELYTDETRTQGADDASISSASRWRRRTASRTARSPISSRRKEPACRDHVGGLRRHHRHRARRSSCEKFKAEHDDYNAIMAEALADRLAEAFAECLHKRVRDEWGFGRDENLTHRRADRGKVPRHPPRRRLSRLPRSHREGHALAAARRGEEHRHQAHRNLRHVARLAASAAFTSRIRESRYFGLGKIDRDQVLDYHARKGMTVAGSRALARAEPQLRPAELSAARFWPVSCLHFHAFLQEDFMAHVVTDLDTIRDPGAGHPGALTDFSPTRFDLWPNVDRKYFKLESSATSRRRSPRARRLRRRLERGRYDWSHPGTVRIDATY